MSQLPLDSVTNRVSESQVIDSLIESNNILQEEVGRLRNNNRVLRVVIKALRSANQNLREQQSIAVQNDEIFKSFCQGDFDVVVSQSGDGGLPEPAVSGETSRES